MELSVERSSGDEDNGMKMVMMIVAGKNLRV